MPSFKKLFEAARKTDEYWVEKSMLDFICELHAEMTRQGKTIPDLAATIKSSPVYITKVLEGETNLTIKSMVKLSHALGCRLHLQMAPDAYKGSWIHAATKPSHNALTTSVPAADACNKRLDYATAITA